MAVLFFTAILNLEKVKRSTTQMEYTLRLTVLYSHSAKTFPSQFTPYTLTSS